MDDDVGVFGFFCMDVYVCQRVRIYLHAYMCVVIGRSALRLEVVVVVGRRDGGGAGRMKAMITR